MGTIGIMGTIATKSIKGGDLRLLSLSKKIKLKTQMKIILTFAALITSNAAATATVSDTPILPASVAATESNFDEYDCDDGEESSYTQESLSTSSSNPVATCTPLLTDPSVNNNYAIKIASENGDLEMVKSLFVI